MVSFLIIRQLSLFNVADVLLAINITWDINFINFAEEHKTIIRQKSK